MSRLKRPSEKCTGCGETRPLWKYLGDRPYCRRCAKKVPPLATIVAVASVDAWCAACGRTDACYQVEFGAHNADTLCLECLGDRLRLLAGEEIDD